MVDRREFLRLGGISALFLPQALLSQREVQNIDEVLSHVWVGAVTPYSAKVAFYYEQEVEAVVHFTSDGDQSSKSSEWKKVTGSNLNSALFTLEGLQPGTRYRYSVAIRDKEMPVVSGEFQTPEYGPYSFSFVATSCAETGSNHQVFEKLREEDPLFFLILGDWFYANVAENDPELFRAAYVANFLVASRQALHQKVPIAYMWDDHDYGPNNSDSSSLSKPAAHKSYTAMVPHYPLSNATEEAHIGQEFIIGRVRFLMPDLRSNRVQGQTLLGEKQKQWLFKQMLAAKTSGQAIVLVSSVSWQGNSGQGDGWQTVPDERQEILHFVEEDTIPLALILSGDEHHSSYYSGSDSFGQIPNAHVAPADSTPYSGYAGPATIGPFLDRGQYGVISVNDVGDATITFTIEGKNSSQQGDTLYVESFAFQLPETQPKNEKMFLPFLQKG